MENTKKAKRIPPNKKYDSVDMLDAVDRDLQAVMKSIEVYTKPTLNCETKKNGA